jgi:hypothetical protein
LEAHARNTQLYTKGPSTSSATRSNARPMIIHEVLGAPTVLVLSKPIKSISKRLGGPMKGYQIICYVLSLAAPTPIHECESFTAYPIINRDEQTALKSFAATLLLTVPSSHMPSKRYFMGRLHYDGCHRWDDGISQPLARDRDRYQPASRQGQGQVSASLSPGTGTGISPSRRGTL